jgi:hypothetical protein
MDLVMAQARGSVAAVVTPSSAEAIQEQLADAVRAFSAALEDDPALSPLPEGHALTETDVLRCVGALLAAAEIELFEFAMWRLWSNGR